MPRRVLIASRGVRLDILAWLSAGVFLLDGSMVLVIAKGDEPLFVLRFGGGRQRSAFLFQDSVLFATHNHEADVQWAFDHTIISSYDRTII